MLLTLDRMYNFAKELDSYGPDYGSEGAAAAYGMASRVAQDHLPLQDGDAAAWCKRVRGVLDLVLRRAAVASRSRAPSSDQRRCSSSVARDISSGR